MLGLFTALLVPRALALEPGIAIPAGFRTDRILVRPTPTANPAALNQLHANVGSRVEKTISGDHRVQVVKLPPGLSVAQAVARFHQSGLVEFAEPDYLIRPLIAPNDIRYQNQDQWNLHNTGIYGGVVGADIDAEPGWDLQHDAPNIIVAVIDTGVRLTHEDLAANLWTNPGETGLDAFGRDKATNGVDDDGNGFIDDVHGINVLNGTGSPLDDWGHGTHVSGIIGAVGNNQVGIAGVAWRVKIMACKFIDASGNASVSDAITCLDYARINGAKIINASWGGYAFTSLALRDAFTRLRDAGIIVTAAAGNDNSNNDTMPLYPASYEFDNIIAVAATDRTDARATFSNYGATTVDLGAPGAPVFSTWGGSDSDYTYYNGTSMAAPHVAGACALLWTRFPGDTYQQIIRRVLTTVDPLPGLAGRTVSGGRLNLAAALASGSSTPPKQAPIAVASASPTSGTAPLTVSFSSVGTYDPDGTIASYRWDFGTGASSTAANPSFTYTTAGTYTAKLTATDNDGLSSSATVSIVASAAANQPPIAAASATPTSGMAPLTVNFSSAGSSDPDGSIASYRWTFGDGSSSSAASPTKTYTTAGNYTAQLTVTDNRGATGTKSVAISVSRNTSGDVDVRQFTLTTSNNSNGTLATATVTVRDRLDRPVSGVGVTIAFSGVVSRTTSAQTNSNGQVTLTSSRSRKSGTETATITTITPPSGTVYDPSIYSEPLQRSVTF